MLFLFYLIKNINSLSFSDDYKQNVTFTNDAYGGSSSTDRNLYVTAVQYNSDVVPNSALALFSTGSATLTFTSTLLTPPSGKDVLLVTLNEDAWKGLFLPFLLLFLAFFFF